MNEIRQEFLNLNDVDSFWEELKLLILDNDNEEIESLLNIVSVTTVRDSRNNSVLHYIVSQDNELIIKQLIKAGCNVNAKNSNQETPLTIAINAKNYRVSKLLLDAGASIQNSFYADYFGPLHLAVAIRSNEIIELLLKAGADANAYDANHDNPIHELCKKKTIENCDIKIAKLLLDVGADVNAKNDSFNTPLHLAILSDNFELAKVILDAGAGTISSNLNSKTPLHLTVIQGNIEFAKHLIEAGANVNLTDYYGQGSLFFAVKQCDLEMTKLLLKAGAWPQALNYEGISPFHWAVHESQYELIKIMLEAAVDVNIPIRDPDGLFPLHIAAEAGKKDIVMILLDFGADINVKCRKGRNVLYYAAKSRHFNENINSESYLDLLKLLVSRGVTIDQDYNENTSSFLSVLRYGTLDATHLLMNHGFDLSKRDQNKISVLLYAALNVDHTVLNFILSTHYFHMEDEGATGMTVLHAAALSQKVNCLNYLIKRGGNINKINKHQETPIFLAIEAKNVECVNVLLYHGADINIKTMKNETLLEAALEKGTTVIVKQIVKYIAMLKHQKVMRELFDAIQAHKYVKIYYENCKFELEYMKQCYIYSTISFFNILSLMDIGPYTRHKQIVKIFEDEDTIIKMFPIYYDLLIKRFTEEVERQKLIRRAKQGLNRIVGLDMEIFQDIFYNICTYLNEYDLLNVIEVGK